MKTIYKYDLPASEHEFSVSMPEGAQLLTAQIQRDVPCVWALVDTTKPVQERRFVVVGTGHELVGGSVGLKYVGTFQHFDGRLVLHLFEVLSLSQALGAVFSGDLL